MLAPIPSGGSTGCVDLRDELRLGQWRGGGSEHTLYLCAPAHDQRRLRGLFIAVVKDVLESAFAASARAGRPLDPPLLVVLDEAWVSKAQRIILLVAGERTPLRVRHPPRPPRSRRPS
jgi:hypothetical protein